MRVRKRYVCGALVLTGMGASYLMLTPRLRLVTRAQIEAALPATLRERDEPDPAARARYARLVEIVGRFRGKARPRAALDDLDALLKEGGFVAPEGPEGRVDGAGLGYLVRELALRADEGGRAACLRDALLGLRLGQALIDLKSSTFDALHAVTLDRDLVKMVYRLDTNGAFDEKGREAILDTLPPLDGTFPQFADGMRRDFQNYVVPMLVDPARFFEERTMSVEGGEPVKAEMVGSYDALETTRLAGRLCEMKIEEARRLFVKRGSDFRKLHEEAASGLPDLLAIASQTGAPRSLARVRYRLAMNSGHNTIGRVIATDMVMDGFSSNGPQRAAWRNLLRAVLLLRMGRPAPVPDPYGTGPLKVDPKRRLVWSVGEDGVDNHGNLGSGGLSDRDLGMKY